MDAKVIRAMKAGRELDALVAYTFFDWRWRSHTTYDVKPDDKKKGVRSRKKYPLLCKPPHDSFSEWLSEPLGGFDVWLARANRDMKEWSEWWGGGFPMFSTDIAAAWKVVEKMIPVIGHIYPQCDEETGKLMHWCAVVECGERERTGVTADTAPLAICHAALIATIK